MATQAHTVQFDAIPGEPITTVYDDVEHRLTVLSGDRMIGMMFLGVPQPLPEPDVVDVEPIVEPDPDAAEEA